MQNLETQRLILRQWKDADLQPFYRLNSDPVVMAYYPSPLTETQSHDLANSLQAFIAENGWGLWAVERKSDGQFIGYVGLNRPRVSLPFAPCIEMGWRLAKETWGLGYATEASIKVLDFAFNDLGVDEIIAFTAVVNQRSEAVMKRLAMQNTHNNFLHPSVPNDSPLREHVLYRLKKQQWIIRHTKTCANES